ncbi:hypothetical protein GCM10009716_28190 [Streptomyces sodiiphilus]|uniref:Uncharacterized protein n=1 Tax=Streptomyces sodiiphilus TaxID=226217 RepID=A0ABN2PER7_9ACTN
MATATPKIMIASVDMCCLSQKSPRARLSTLRVTRTVQRKREVIAGVPRARFRDVPRIRPGRHHLTPPHLPGGSKSRPAGRGSRVSAAVTATSTGIAARNGSAVA